MDLILHRQSRHRSGAILPRHTRRLIGAFCLMGVAFAAVMFGTWSVVAGAAILAATAPILMARTVQQNAAKHGIPVRHAVDLAAIATIDVDPSTTRVDVVTHAVMRSLHIGIGRDRPDVIVRGLCGSIVGIGQDQIVIRGGLPTLLRGIAYTRHGMTVRRIAVTSLTLLVGLTAAIGFAGGSTIVPIVLLGAAIVGFEATLTYLADAQRFSATHMTRFERRVVRKIETAFRAI